MTQPEQTWLVTGGAGFIGYNFVRMARAEGWARIVNLDILGYAANPLAVKGEDNGGDNAEGMADDPGYRFVQGDIGDAERVRSLLREHRPTAVVNFAAQTHVDRSILGPRVFVDTNVVGTFTLLGEVLEYWRGLEGTAQGDFRFLHVSTDEVYGTLTPDAPAFTEAHPYAPNSPYSASKAASDHFVRAMHHTYGLPVLTTNCSNNYGPYQFPEKLIPLMILNALEGKPLPIYGDGQQVRDWLYVEDHCTAIRAVLQGGTLGEVYNIGGNNQRTNMEVVHQICALLDELAPQSPHRPHTGLITHVEDRPGHDRRYAINDTKLRTELGWQPAEHFEGGLEKTVRWYLEAGEWLGKIRDSGYQEWVKANYGARRTMTGGEGNA